MQRFGPYRVGETIGRGSMATVKVAVHERTNMQVALKIIPRKNLEAQAAKERDAMKQAGKASDKDPAAGRGLLPTNVVAAKIALEIKVLKLLKHPHVIRLYDVIFTPNDVVLVLEYAAGGELFDHLNDFGRLAEAQARTLFQQLLSALEYCHTNRVAHRDLKPENIILDRGSSSLKLTDFDLAGRIVDGQLFDVSCGTPNYAAPEVVSGQLYNGPEADVWSAGIVLYAMLTGRLPFDDENVQSLFRRIKSGEFTIPATVSPLARDLLSRIIVVDPLQRMTIQQAFAHPWVTTAIPRYIVEIHDRCVQYVSGTARTGPDADGHRHDMIATVVSTAEAVQGVAPDGGMSLISAAAALDAPAGQQQQQPQPPSPASAAGVAPRKPSEEDLGLLEDDGGNAAAAPAAADTTTTTAPAATSGPSAGPAVDAALGGAESTTALFKPGTAADTLGIGVVLDHEVLTEVATLFQMSLDDVEQAIENAIMRREGETREQLHRLVHGVSPKVPLRFDCPPPMGDRKVAAVEHDALVTYAIIKHKRRAMQATRHRDPTTSASLGAGLASSLPAVGAGAASPSLQQRSAAVALHEHAVASDLTGQGTLGGLRACKVGWKAVVPPPGEFVTQTFNASSYSLSGIEPRRGASLREYSLGAGSLQAAAAASASSPGAIGSYGAGSHQSTRSASGAVVVRQPPAINEPSALRIPHVSSAVYNGLSKRPGRATLALVNEAREEANEPGASASPMSSSALAEHTSPFPEGSPVTPAMKEQHAMRRELSTLMDKEPQLGPGADAAAEAWAQTYRVGVMAEGRSAPSTFNLVFAVLKRTGFVWKIVRPFHVCALDHVTRTKLNVQLIRCASNVPNKWIVDVRVSPLCAMPALHRVAELMDALATEFSSDPRIPMAAPSLVAAGTPAPPPS